MAVGSHGTFATPGHRGSPVRHDGGVSENLKMLGEYSDAMFRGDEQAVFEFWAPEFHSHVTDRVNPAVSGTDVRSHEVVW